MIKLKDLLNEDKGDISSVVKFNIKIDLDGVIDGNEEDVLKFKKDVEEKIQAVIDEYEINATWRLT